MTAWKTPAERAGKGGVLTEQNQREPVALAPRGHESPSTAAPLRAWGSLAAAASRLALPDTEHAGRVVGDWRRADPRLAELLNTGVGAAAALDRYALMARQEGRIADAAMALKMAVALSPDEPGLWGNLAAALAAADEAAGAAVAIEIGLGLDGSRVDGWIFLGSLRMAAGDDDGAEAAYGRAAELAPRRPDVWHALALSAYRRRQFAIAAERFQASIERGDRSPLAYAHLGQTRHLTGDFAGALDAFAAAHAAQPDDDHTRHMLGLLRLMETVPADGGDWNPDGALAAYRATAGSAAWDANRLLQTAFGLLSGYGRLDAARAVGRVLLARKPDSATLRYLMAVLGGANPDRCPDDYLIEHFDAFAETFDTQLVEVLGYRVPERLCRAIGALIPAMGQCATADLGCGTGLAGPLLRPFARHLTGIDLAPRMLEKAGARGVYDDLVQAEAVSWLAARRADLDLVLAADVLIYIGDLAPLFAAAAGALRPGGLFAVSIETIADRRGDDYRALPSGRFAHAPSHVAALAAGDFIPVHDEPTVIRLEANRPAEGRLLVFKRN